MVGCVLQHFPPDHFPRVVDVGGGTTCRIAQALHAMGYHVTVIDPQAPRRGHGLPSGVKAIREPFLVRHTRGQDLLVALAPCEATQKVIRAAKRKPLVLWPCGCRHIWPDDASVTRAAPACFREHGIEYRKQGQIFWTPRPKLRSDAGFAYLRSAQ